MKTRFHSVTYDTWTALPDTGASVVTIVNLTGVDAKIRRADDTDHEVTLKTGSAIDLSCANAQEFEIKRASGTGNLTAELLID